MKYNGNDEGQQFPNFRMDEEGSDDNSNKPQVTPFNADKLKRQAQEVRDMLEKMRSEFESDDQETYYILSKKYLNKQVNSWFDKWKLHVSYDEGTGNKKFGQMMLQNMNSDLIEYQVSECFKYNPLNTHPWNTWLKQNLKEDIDYIVITSQISNYLNQYYRGTTIIRNAIGSGFQKKVVVNLLRFYAILIVPNTINQISQDNLTQLDKEFLQVDENCSLKEYYALIQKTVPTFRGNYQSQNGVRIWKYTNQNDPHKALFAEIKKQVQDLDFNDDLVFDFSGEPIENSETLYFRDLNLTDKDVVLIEFQQICKPWCVKHPSVPVEGKCENCNSITVLNFPCVCKKVSYCSEICKTNDERYHLPRCDRCGSDDEQVKSMDLVDNSVRGVAGLSNLGNTCFMNSGTQCLANTYPLVEYFISNKYFTEINEDNPLGTKGQLVRKFGSLVKKLWCGDKNVVIPTSFKKAVGQFQPMFKGFQQHDSSELITFLLDGLHEDLNRVKKKPYVESKDSHGRPDFEVAKESWENHLARNQSIIVDLMHGQYKSTLRCPTCSQISITFDPFLTVGLGIPNRKIKSVQVKLAQSIVQSEIKTINFDQTKKNLQLGEFIKEFIIPEFKLDPAVELVFFIQFSTEAQDPLAHNVPINEVRKSSKRGNLIAKVLNAEELSVPVEERVFLSFSQKANDGYGQQYKRIIQAPTFVIIKKEYTFKQIHLEIFKALLPIFCDAIDKEEIKIQEYYEEHILNKYYNVQFKSNGMYWKACSFCSQKNCSECFAEYMDETYEDVKTKVQANDPQVKVELLIFWIQSPFQHIKPADIYTYYTNQQYKKAMEEEENNKGVDDNNNTNNNKYVPKNQNLYSQQLQQKATLYECLKHSEQPEQLGEDNTWYCKVCKEHVQAFKSMQIYKVFQQIKQASDILIFSLKRFKASHGLFKQKLETFVDFPINNLDLKEFILNKNRPNDYEKEAANQHLIQNQESLIYDLYAVSNHFGGMGGGHYTAFAKNHINGKWYNFDDSQVSEVDEDQIITKNAYVLFYKLRKDSDQLTQTISDQIQVEDQH